MTRADAKVGGLALTLLALGFLVRPVALRLDVTLRVADACFPWHLPGAMRYDGVGPDQRTWTFMFRTPPPDPWGRAWAFRAPTTADAGRAVPLAFDPADPAAPFVQGGPTRVVYSLGPDGKDDGGVAGPDVIVGMTALQRLVAIDTAAEAGGWLAGLVLLAWVVGRAGARRRRWFLGVLPLVLGALIGALRTVGRVQLTAVLPKELPSLPLVIPLEGAAILSLLAVLGLVAGLGWTTTRAQCAGEGASVAGG